MVIYSIYKIKNKINGKIYIGYTKQAEFRKKQHFNCRGYSKIKKAILDYGEDNFEWEIIYQSKDKYNCLGEMEAHFIQQYNSVKNGYNVSFGQKNDCPSGLKDGELEKLTLLLGN